MKPADSRGRYDVHRNLQELIMMRWIGVAVVAGVVALAAPASATTAAPTRPQAAAQQRHVGKVTDLSAQRRYRHYYRHHYHYGYRPYARPYYRPYSYYRPYDPYYYGRPSYYRPYPYVSPAPFAFGFGFGPFW
jgi:hypothetical protein